MNRQQRALQLAELKAWNAAVQRSIAEYRRRPITYGRPCACTICRRGGRCVR